MFLLPLKWPILFWNITSNISIDSFYKKWRVVYSTLLMISCVYNFYITPKTVCQLEGDCNHGMSAEVKGIFIRIVAISCFISRLVIVTKGKTQLIRYEKIIEKIHVISPTTHSEVKVLKKISTLLIACCILLTIPANILRIWDLSYRPDFTIIVFIFMYTQNFSMYCVETQFITLCFVLFRKLVGINRDLMALKIDTVVRNNYPFMTQTQGKHGKINDTCDYNREMLLSLAAGHPMTDFVEQLKIKHKLVRDAVKTLSDLFGVHMGLSIFVLSLCTMFDMYYFILGVLSLSSYKKVFYIWILQYTVRFGSITILSHLTTKQVILNYFLMLGVENTFIWLKMRIRQLCAHNMR